MAISLKAHRINADYKQSEVADLMGVTSKTIWMWERDYKKIPTGKLLELCKLYGISIDDIG